VSGVQPDQSDAEMLRPEVIQERLKSIMPSASDYPIVNARIYNVHQRVAKTFRRGRILLLGDAAHINNPMGGQGLNCGIHDAFNLAPKFTAVWRGDAGTEVLDLYDRQRRITNWEYIQRISVENKKRNEEPDVAKRKAAMAFLRSLVDNDEARFAFYERWSMGESLDYAATITLDHPAEARPHAVLV
jgi:3-(3-hydroxy-phenyl)propionate hydroxylase